MNLSSLILGRRNRPLVGSALEACAGIASAYFNTALPIASVVKLAAAIVPAAPEPRSAVEARFVAAVGTWMDGNRELLTGVSDDHEGWEGLLLDAFNDRGLGAALSPDPETQDWAVQLVAHTVFVPLMSSGQAYADQAARKLIEALPDLIVEAGGQIGEFAALRTIFDRRIDVVLERLDEISDRLPASMAEEVAVQCYLTYLRTTLASDPWAVVIQGTEQFVDDAFQRRRVTLHEPGHKVPPDPGQDPNEPTDLDPENLADSCRRLVILGGPGSGKSWLAKHLAIRATFVAEESIQASGSDLTNTEIPLFARASAVLDAPEDVAPWVALTRTAVTGLGARVDEAGASALLSRIDRDGGRYLVILDGLDEARNFTDANRLRLLLETPGRSIRLVLTGRPASWRDQVSLDPGLSSATNAFEAVEHSPKKDEPALLTEAVVDLTALDDDEVRSAIGAILSQNPTSRSKLIDRLDHDEHLSELARTPLMCVMLCVATAGEERVPERRTILFERVVTLLLRSSWRHEVPDPAPEQARRALSEIASRAAVEDPVTGLGAWNDRVRFTPDGLTPDAMLALDAVAPVPRYLSMDRAQSRQFIHESLRSHLLAEHVAALDVTAAADRLRDHLWFDPDWADVIPAALALHPNRSSVFRRLLDLPDGHDSIEDAVVRLDGFGEIQRLLTTLARETDAVGWDPSIRETIGDAALAAGGDDPRSGMRLELIRGGWVGGNLRTDDLRHLGSGDPPWPDRDLADGIASLRLTDRERREAAESCVAVLTTGPDNMLERAARTLLAICTPGTDDVRRGGAAALLQRLQRDPYGGSAAALVILGPDDQERQLAAESLVAALERVEFVFYVEGPVRDLNRDLVRLGLDDDELAARAAHKTLALFRATKDGKDLAHYAGGLGLVANNGETCLAAIDHTLMAMGHLDGYDVGRLDALVMELKPASDSTSFVIHGLLRRHPDEWPRWDIARRSIAQLANQLETTSRTALMEEVVSLLREAPLVDTPGWADLLKDLDPDERRRTLGGEVVLARLRETRDGVLTPASALRTIGPSPDQGQDAAMIILDRLRAASDPGLRFALARGILWFRASDEVRSAAINELILQVRTDPMELARLGGSDEITPDEQARIFDALVDLLGERAIPGVGSALVSMTVDVERQKRAAAALLGRVAADPETYPSDWMMPAAALGSSEADLQAANGILVKSIQTRPMREGVARELGEIWSTIPLTDEQRRDAVRDLSDSLVDAFPPWLVGILGLMDELGMDDQTRTQSQLSLRSRAKRETEWQEYFTRALEFLDPTLTRRRGPILKKQLKAGFQLDIATKLADLAGDEGTRRWLCKQLALWSAEDPDAGWSLYGIRRLADKLEFGVDDLDAIPMTAEPTDAVRQLVSSARHRCSGEAWRHALIARTT